MSLELSTPTTGPRVSNSRHCQERKVVLRELGVLTFLFLQPPHPVLTLRCVLREQKFPLESLVVSISGCNVYEQLKQRPKRRRTVPGQSVLDSAEYTRFGSMMFGKYYLDNNMIPWRLFRTIARHSRTLVVVT